MSRVAARHACWRVALQVVEVGSLNGELAIQIAQLPNVQSVLSFEPTPGRAATIRQTIATRLASNPEAAAKITVRSEAVSDHNGVAKFFTSTSVGGAVNSLGTARPAPAPCF